MIIVGIGLCAGDSIVWMYANSAIVNKFIHHTIDNISKLLLYWVTRYLFWRYQGRMALIEQQNKWHHLSPILLY